VLIRQSEFVIFLYLFKQTDGFGATVKSRQIIKKFAINKKIIIFSLNTEENDNFFLDSGNPNQPDFIIGAWFVDLGISLNLKCQIIINFFYWFDSNGPTISKIFIE
jgi:hypothetical protein